MSKHIHIGNNGEEIATQFLLSIGYEILERNYRYKKSEIDIIARDNTTIVFVEVKTRNSQSNEGILNSVTDSKIIKLQEGAEAYLEKKSITGLVRFDIIWIILSNSYPDIEHIKDAFWG